MKIEILVKGKPVRTLDLESVKASLQRGDLPKNAMAWDEEHLRWVRLIELPALRAAPRRSAGAQSKSAQWYYHLGGGEIQGPMTREELRQRLKTRQIPGDAFVIKPGTESWVRASAISELMADSDSDRLGMVPKSPAENDGVGEESPKGHRRRTFATVGIGSVVLAAGLYVFFQMPPAHTSPGSNGEWQPDAGYSWTSNSGWGKRVVWSPGQVHPQNPHVYSHTNEGSWCARPGYVFANEGANVETQWKPGLRHPEILHISSARNEGYWLADVGYEFIQPRTSIVVRWAPGRRDPKNPRLVAAEQEGEWFTETAEAPHARRPRQPGEAEIQAALVKIFTGALAHALGKPRQNDDLMDALFGEGAKLVGDYCIESALWDLFPEAPEVAIRQATTMISLALNGQLTAANWETAKARQEFMQGLRDENVDAATAVEVADFIQKVYERRLQNR